MRHVIKTQKQTPNQYLFTEITTDKTLEAVYGPIVTANDFRLSYIVFNQTKLNCRNKTFIAHENSLKVKTKQAVDLSMNL